MTRSIALILLATSVSLTMPDTAGAQLGGLIKKKVKEAVKPPEKPAAAPAADAPAAASQPSAESSRTKGNGLKYVDGNSIVINRESLSRLMRGMDAELAMIADFEKFLATWPTSEQYEQCKQRVAFSPEGKKTMDPMYNPPKGISSEDYLKLQSKVINDMQALTDKGCPRNPSTWGPGERSRRLEQIHAKAASLARAKPAAATSTTNPRESGKQMLLLEVDPYEAVSDTTDSITVIGEGGMGDHEYSVMIERILKYCDLKESMDMSPKGSGLKIEGEGKDLYWIYLEEELETLKDFDCASFKRKYKRLIG